MYNQPGYQNQPFQQGPPQPNYQPPPQQYYQPPPQQYYQPPPQQTYQPPPVISNNNNITPIIINNQTGRTGPVVYNDPSKFRTESVLATCPSCRVSSSTNVHTTVSISNVCCCLCFCPVVFIIYNLVRGKDILCCDATHYCASCGAFLANYQAC